MFVNGVLPQDFDGVDPLFREFYNELGGVEILGPAISPVFTRQGVDYQYTAAALLVRDPNAPNTRVFHLAALGQDMDVAKPPIPKPDNPDGRYVEGHVIHSAFLPLYDRLNGQRYVGLPLTEMHLNQDEGRFEQYFENLGMYYLESEGPEHVRLLSYGAWKCDASCRKWDEPESAVPELRYRIDEIFYEAVDRLGADFTGFAISNAYETPDEFLEQVFENAVLISDPEHPGLVFVRPIIESLGIKADQLTVPSGKNGEVFYPVKDGLGHNVPRIFDEYIALHGGIDASGLPITEFSWRNDRVGQQCFANVCLELHRQDSGDHHVRPVQHGYTYRKLPNSPLRSEIPEQSSQPMQNAPDSEADVSQPVPTPEATVASFSQSQSRELTMRVWESYGMLAQGQNQEIGVSLLENNNPMPNIEPYLVLTFPDGQEKTYYMFPTGEDGVSRMLLDPIDLPNGTMINYLVCILDFSYEKYCVKDSFLMWQNP